MITAWILLTLSLGLLIIAADQFIEGAATLAHRYHISPLVIGLTLIALGTSAPEIAITVIAAIEKKASIALGNVIGSNIANIALVMGAVLLISPSTSSSLSRPKLYFLGSSMLLTLCLFLDFFVSRLDGLLLLTLFAGFLTYLYFSYQRFSQARLNTLVYPESQIKPYPIARIIIGGILLPVAATITIQQAVFIAKALGMSDTVIGLTILAVGTSLPELVTSLTSCAKGQYDMAIGNILGSNIFNLLLVLPFIGLLSPGSIDSNIVHRDILMMIVTSLSVLGLSTLPKYGLRLLGFALIASYIIYLTLLALP